jgi:hypothetical protein
MKAKQGIILAIVAIAAVVLIAFAPQFGFVSRPSRPYQDCINNLRLIESAKEYFGETHGLITNGVIVSNVVLTPSQLSTNYILRGFDGLHCPDGGTYFINALSEDPTCSFVTKDERHSLHRSRKR